MITRNRIKKDFDKAFLTLPDRQLLIAHGMIMIMMAQSRDQPFIDKEEDKDFTFKKVSSFNQLMSGLNK